MKASNLRLANQRIILRHLQRHGSDSKAGIAEACHMSKPTAGTIIDNLLDAGVIVEDHGEQEQTALGRPSQALTLDQRTPRFVLIELGVRRLTMRLVAMSGAELSAQQEQTPADKASCIAVIAKWWQQQNADDLWAAVISVPGVIDEDSMQVLKSPNMPWTEGRSFLQALEATLHLPLYPVQEIRALALSHLHLGADSSSFLYVHSDDGLGAALVIDGMLFKGASALSAELGHTPIAGNTRQCGCGNIGCLETLAAGPGLMQSYDVDNWPALINAMQQDPRALDESLEHVAVHIAATVNISGVKHVVLGSRFEAFPEASLHKLVAHIKTACLWSQFGDMQVDMSDAGFAQGLVAYVFEHAVMETSDWSKPCQRQIA